MKKNITKIFTGILYPNPHKRRWEILGRNEDALTLSVMLCFLRKAQKQIW